MTDTRDLLVPWRRLYEQKRHKKSPEDGMEWGNGRGVWAEGEGQRIKKGDAAAETTLRMENFAVGCWHWGRRSLRTGILLMSFYSDPIENLGCVTIWYGCDPGKILGHLKGKKNSVKGTRNSLDKPSGMILL